ncbi:hypothetical protein JCM6882_003949 [Rhodosporidiobolus microsporus]
MLSLESTATSLSIVVGLELDLEFLLSLAKESTTKSFSSQIPGQPAAVKLWFVQSWVVADSQLRVGIWRAVEDGEIAASVTNSTQAAAYETGFHIARLPALSEELKVVDKKRLWSRRYRLEILILHNTELFKTLKVPMSDAAKQEVGRAAAPLLIRAPHDVKLSFSDASTPHAALWTSADTLASFSPYFKTLLASEFSEAVTFYANEEEEKSKTSVSTEKAEDAEMHETDEEDSDDSDDELDDFFFSSPPSSLSFDPSGSRPYRRVTVRGAWSTYRAILAYATTGHLSFAPLQSSRISEAGSSAHLNSLKTHLSATPALPLPVSPKSVYRAAHLLELPSLTALALRDFRRQLTPSVAVAELFSPVSARYDELRAVALEYVVKSWADVKDSEGFGEVKERVKKGELKDAGPVLIELLEKVEERRAAMA